MPNYEELYNSARNRYNQAIDERNRIRRERNELEGRKKALKRELEAKQNSLADVQQKIAVVTEAKTKCNDIINDDFSTLSTAIRDAGDEYKKVLASDMGVADLQSIYSEDMTSTKNDLNAICTEMDTILRGLEEQEAALQKEIANLNSELSSVINRLNNLGSEWSAQQRANNNYAEMKEYEAKWLNGE